MSLLIRCVTLVLGLGGWWHAAVAADARSLNALLDGVFAAHVNDGYVDYPEIARNVRFHKYLEAIAEVDLATLGDEREQLAFWINVYNALAVKQIIDGMSPIGTLGRMKFFRTTNHRVGARNFDLQDIEDDILYKAGEPRVHFAMVNASYSAAKLRSGAYRADELEQQLEEQTRDFVRDVRKNRFSMELRQAKVSQIFEWRKADFGGDDAGVLAFLARYVADEALAAELAGGRFTVKYLEYEWSINGRPM